MVQGIRGLADLVRRRGTIQATCRACGRVALFDVGELAAHFTRKGWDSSWPGFARRLRCGDAACGARNPAVAWLVADPPPDTDPPPPRPRFARAASPAPLGVDQGEWARARDDRERRLLIRRARG
jgi:hypothetical protein